MAAYAKQAKDAELIDLATDIRLRAERRAGELLRDMPKNVGAVPGKTGIRAQPVLDDTPTLADLGVTKAQSSRWQKLAELDDGDFERRVATAKKQAVASVEQTAAERTAQPLMSLDERAFAQLGKIVNGRADKGRRLCLCRI